MIHISEIKKGSRVVVKGGFGNEPEQTVTVDGVHSNIKNGIPGIDYTQDDGACRWAYLHQVVRIIPSNNPHADKILKLVNAAYENGECRIDEDIPADERGDGLATFIRNEIIDVCQGEPDYKKALALVSDALGKALQQVNDISDAVDGEYYK